MVARPSRWTLALGLSILLASVLWLTVAWLTPGYEADIESRKARAKWVTENGIEDAYRMRIDYPPANLYLFAAVGHFYQATVDPRFDRRRAAESQLLTWLIKLPPTLFHFATAVTVYLLTRREAGPRLAWSSATLLLFDPAAVWDVAHQGQYDPVHSLFSLLALAAVTMNRSVLAGVAIGLAALTKPQSWILIPLIGFAVWRTGRLRSIARASLGCGLALALGLLPFIVNRRLSDVGRLWEYMNTNSTANHVISANADNLWWLATLAAGRWIDDWEPLIGHLSYRTVALLLVLSVLVACLRQLGQLRPRSDIYLLAATLGAGWFFFTVRAHEYHAFFVLPFLAMSWPTSPKRLALYGLASVGILANLVLHDPLVVGALADIPDPARPFPAWYVWLTVANVAIFATLLLGLAREARLATQSTRSVARVGAAA
jgi:hypothetical protein